MRKHICLVKIWDTLLLCDQNPESVKLGFKKQNKKTIPFLFRFQTVLANSLCTWEREQKNRIEQDKAEQQEDIGPTAVSIAWPVQEIPSQLVIWVSHEKKDCRKKSGGLDVWRWWWKNRRGRGREEVELPFSLRAKAHAVLSLTFPPLVVLCWVVLWWFLMTTFL